ncbi:MAG: cytochrome c3 family protein [Desulfobacteraceae bacterium]|nr:cytochrome c3 family protein [Desulfobacteraceae bacterium]
MKRFFVGLIVLMAAVFIAVVGDAENKNTGIGEAVIHLEKGRMPQVTFPHHMHQKALDNNCNACHDMFPKQPGIIKEMIFQEKLRKKQVMNSKCLKCHKDQKKAGLASGPTQCSACHVRSK